VERYISYRRNIFILELHHQLRQVYGDDVTAVHHVKRGCREFRIGLPSLMMVALSAEQIEDM
jgi:hypothetical protein